VSARHAGNAANLAGRHRPTGQKSPGNPAPKATAALIRDIGPQLRRFAAGTLPA